MRAPTVLARAGGVVDDITGVLVGDVAQAGADDAVAIVEEYARRVAIGLVGLVNIFDPERVVVSGGLVELDDVLLAPLRAAFDGRIEGAPYRPAVPIVAAELGGQAGVVGAAVLGPGARVSARESPRDGVKLGLTLPSFRDDVATSLAVAAGRRGARPRRRVRLRPPLPPRTRKASGAPRSRCSR